MPRKPPTTRALSDKHAEEIFNRFGARITRGSGNQFSDQLDNRMEGDGEFLFGFEGKATQKASMSIKLNEWQKLVAQSHDLRPAMAHRFYRDDYTLTPIVDLITVKIDDFDELLSCAEAYVHLERDRQGER